MKKSLITLSAALVCLTTLAVPAKRGLSKNIKLADGTVVKAELRGDEFCHYWQSEDGQTFVVDTQTGLYERADINALEGKAQARRAAANETRVRRSPAMRIGEAHDPYVGKKKGLIILVNFTDVKFKPEHTLELYKRIANETGFSEMGYRGSIKDYFLDQSYGKFELDFDVAGPVELPHECAYYGYTSGKSPNGDNDNTYAIGEMVVDACTEAAQEYDFSQYDWDGDGEVEQVFLLYAGYGEASGGEFWTIWPHEFSLIGAIGRRVRIGGVYVNTYACGNEIVPSGSSYTTSGIGTVCHEFSHCLGLPDMYDTSGNGYYGMGSWDLMDNGSYNGDQLCPAGYTSYERMYAGWLQPTELTTDCQVDNMKALADGEEAYIIYNDAHKDEYYLLENRQKTGWDAELPGSGMLISHVDFNLSVWQSNTVNSRERQRCTIFPADNSASATSERGDTYPYRQNNSLTNTSLPAATLNNQNTDGSLFMNKSVTEITQNEDGTMAFSFSNLTDMEDDYELPQSYIFYESFDQCAGTGGNDGGFSGSAVGKGELLADNAGWETPEGHGADQCAMFGSAAVDGEATTPEIDIDGEHEIWFKAAPYSTDASTMTLEVSEGDAELAKTSFTIRSNTWTACHTTLTGKGKVRLTFKTQRRRLFLDKVCVTDANGQTGISNVATGSRKAGDGRIYSLDGRYAGKDLNALQKGIYIVDGKKIIK